MHFSLPGPMKTLLRPALPFLAFPLAVFAAASAGPPQPLKPLSAAANSTRGDAVAALAIDGKFTDASRWLSRDALPATLEITLGSVVQIGGIHLYSGFDDADPVEDFSVQFWSAGKWRDIPSAVVVNNRSTALVVAFDTTVAVVTDRLRITITKSHQNTARIKEVVVWPSSVGDVPPLPALAGKASPAVETVPEIFLNQSGFNLGKPKRFTAPTLADGTPFAVRLASGGPALAQGLVQGNLGDFSDFNPDSAAEFVVEAGGLVSVPFRIGPNWLERVTYQNAVNFMIDSRHLVGNDRTPCPGTFGWRDDHHFGWELHTLVPQYLSNPSAYERMTRQISYEAPSGKNTANWGALQPPAADAPDIVKLIHWGADVIVTQRLGHELLKSQLAYFLYAWPVLKTYLPAQNYEVVRDYAFARWSEPKADRAYPYDFSPEHDLLALKTKIGTTKGQYPPGFSIQPNLMMHAVALREHRAAAPAYLAAARKQAEWMIANLDWNDPLVTKGQRMSEFITITGLAYFLSEYPDQAPAGLAKKIDDWAAVVVRRSANLWDFRKLGDASDQWTPMGDQPTMWNEVGNITGLPAAILAALPAIPDPAIRARFEVIAWSHLDNMFGRNPTGRHFSYDAPREIEGVEHGWYKFLPGGIGRLAEARFVLDGSPKNHTYPYKPENGPKGWTEGWIQFNTPFNLSLAYLAAADTRLAAAREGESLVVRLRAPLNFDYAKVESGTVVVTTPSGDREPLTVTEDSVSAAQFTGRLPVAAASVRAGDGILQAVPGEAIEVSYGFGYLGHRITVPVGP